MYELTHKEGWKTLARIVQKADGSIALYEWDSDWELRGDCWVWCEYIG